MNKRILILLITMILYDHSLLMAQNGNSASAPISATNDSYLEYLGKDAFVNELKGAEISTGSILPLRDDHMDLENVLSSEVIRSFSVRNYLTFEANIKSSLANDTNVFLASVDVAITIIDSLGNSSVVTKTLNLSFNPLDSVIKVKDVYSFVNGHILQVEILNLTTSDIVDINNLTLRSEIYTERINNFDCELVPSLFVPSYDSNKDELIISWASVTGNELEYDLEWTFIDKYAPNYNNAQTSQDISSYFIDNSTRISTKSTEYHLPMTFTEGLLLFRVRAVSINPNLTTYLENITKIYSLWSSNLNSKYVFNGLDLQKNWISNTQFVEDARRHVNLTYFDGALKERQIISKTDVDLDNRLVITNKYYDRLWRLGATTLPTPANINYLKYHSKFNKNISLAALGFSTNDLPDDICHCISSPMSSIDGAGKYYSEMNLNIPNNDRLRVTIPDAEGFPYNQVLYVNDNSNRIRKQGGFGKALRIDGDHSTNYFYGKPSLEELIKLFGSDVGEENTYSKEAVIDQNSQVSITYKDGHDRIVATSLSGIVPENVDELSDFNQASTFTVDLLKNQIANDYGFLAEYPFIVVNANSTYNFSYDLGQIQRLILEDCNGVDLCYDCEYNVKLYLSNECGILDSVKRVFSLSNLNFDCNYKPDDSQYQLSLNHTFDKPGNYFITKQLELSKDAINSYAEDFVNKNDCQSYSSFLQQAIGQLDFSSCNLTCEQCLQELGTKAHFLSNYPVNPIQQEEIDSLSLVYDQLYAACQKLCGNTLDDVCEQYLDQMKLDVSIGGQYLSSNVDANNLILDRASLLYEEPGHPAPYKNSTLQYKNDDGSPSFVYINGVSYTPNELSGSDFISNFQSSWIDELVKMHPEYCYYQKCIQEKAKILYAQEVQKVTTWDEAKAKGMLYFVDPDLNSTNSNNIILVDPFYTNSNIQFFFLDYTEYLQIPTSPACSLNMLQAANASIMLSSPSSGTLTCQDFIVPLASIENLCNGDKNAIWNVLKGIYINKRNERFKHLFYDATHIPSSPPFSCINNYYIGGNDSHLAQAGYIPNVIYGDKQPRFTMFPPTIISNLNSNVPNPLPTSNPVSYSPPTNNSAVSVCNEYLQIWQSDLDGCSMLNASQKQDLIDKFTEICIASFDFNTHPYGASSVPQSIAVLTYQSFEEAFNAIVPNSNFTSICNPLLFTIPEPYDNSESTLSSVVYDQIESCTCSTLTALTTEFELVSDPTHANSSVDYEQFSKYLFEVYQNSISGEELKNLIDFCDASNTCNYLPEAIDLPPILQCRECKTCEEVKNKLNEFNTTYPTLSSISEDKKNALLTTYLNNSFNFTYTFNDYNDFLKNCPGNYSEFSCANISNAIAGWNLLNSPKPPLCFYLNQTFNKNMSIAEWNSYMNTTDPEKCNLIITISISLDKPDCDMLRLMLINYWSNPQVDKTSTWQASLESFFDLNYWNSNGDLIHSLEDCKLENYLYPATDSKCTLINDILNDLNNSNAVNQLIDFNFEWLLKVHDNLFPFAELSYSQNVIELCTGIPLDRSIDCNYLNNLKLQFNNSLSIVSQTFGQFVNQQNNWNYNEDSYAQWQTSCFENGFRTNIQKLCWQPTMGETPHDTNSCFEDLLLTAQFNAQHNYELFLEKKREEFINQYKEKCLSTLVEIFNMSYAPMEYHYTLYYYDRGDNLMKTIPPAGVKTLSMSEINDVVNNNAIIYPNHQLPTLYHYNTMHKLVWQSTPDGGVSNFWYDELGRLIVSQNNKQKNENSYSYTVYDDLSRIIEVGKIYSTIPPPSTPFFDDISFLDWVNGVASSQYRKEITRTYYDEAQFGFPDFTQENLRMRVASITYQDEYDADVNRYLTGTHYSYDLMGNVKSIIQENKQLEGIAHSLKRIDYFYDEISGKVNKVIYQENKPEQYFHQYDYDADNKIIKTSTGTNKDHLTTDATYEYYLHGPLARTVLGESMVQGLDYSYTIQGWLKSMNGGARKPGKDIGRDGWFDPVGNPIANPNLLVARDAVAFSLNYFNDLISGNDDYKPIGGPQYDPDLDEDTYTVFNQDEHGASLYNGNIRSMSVHIRDLDPINYRYRYDQLNRIVGMKSMVNPNIGGWKWDNPNTMLNKYDEAISYDPNGNILTYSRNDENGGLMDEMNYSYYTGSNKLRSVYDNVVGSACDWDIESPPPGPASSISPQFEYDEIGNLVSDHMNNLSISWNNYGKIDHIINTQDNTSIYFTYDPMGNRVRKINYADDSNKSDYTATYYVHDAQGNVMAIYNERNIGNNRLYNLNNWTMYGSSRLGIVYPPKDYVIYDTQFGNTWNFPIEQMNVGLKRYEITNHLGNVLATITDKPMGIDSITTNEEVEYFEPSLASASDYYPFGMLMPSRSIKSEVYRSGFNGQERDDEIAGVGNFNTALYWEYDTRLGRRWNVDPEIDQKPDQSSYSCLYNNPIIMIDPFGNLETEFKDANGKTIKTVDDGSNAVFQENGQGTEKHYEYKGYNEKLGGKNEVNITTAIQEQQDMNNTNPSLQENAQGQGETHCNQATQCIMKTVSSTETDPNAKENAVVSGNANTMVSKLDAETNPNYQKVDQTKAEAHAKNGGLAVIGWSNPKGGHGHILTYSVGTNIKKGVVANIGPKKYSGFVSLNGAISKTKPKSFYIYTPGKK